MRKVLGKEVYSEEEFCKKVGISLRLARKLRKAGELTHGRTGRKLWYTQTHIQRYFEEHTVAARSAA